MRKPVTWSHIVVVVETASGSITNGPSLARRLAWHLARHGDAFVVTGVSDCAAHMRSLLWCDAY